jgi:hypothetical protein
VAKVSEKERNKGKIRQTKSKYSTYDKDGNFGEEYQGDTEEIFYCPECHRTLFFDEDDAYDFLNGEKVEVVVEENEV